MNCMNVEMLNPNQYIPNSYAPTLIPLSAADKTGHIPRTAPKTMCIIKTQMANRIGLFLENCRVNDNII